MNEFDKVVAELHHTNGELSHVTKELHLFVGVLKTLGVVVALVAFAGLVWLMTINGNLNDVKDDVEIMPPHTATTVAATTTG